MDKIFTTVEKLCNKCKEIRELSSFSKDSYKKDGLSTVCKICVKTYFNSKREYFLLKKKEYRENNKNIIKIKKSIWDANHIEHIKSYSRSYHILNRPRLLIKARRYYSNNRLKIIKASLRYFKKHPYKAVANVARRRARKLRTQIERITHLDLIAIKEQYNYCCAYCGVTDSENNKIQIDHVYPLSKGGSHTLLNLLPACRNCNYRKHNKLPLEWFNICGLL